MAHLGSIEKLTRKTGWNSRKSSAWTLTTLKDQTQNGGLLAFSKLFLTGSRCWEQAPYQTGLTRAPPTGHVENIMTIGVYGEHAFLIKNIDKLTKHYECEHCHSRFSRAGHFQSLNISCSREIFIDCPAKDWKLRRQISKEPFFPKHAPLSLNRICGSKNGQNCAKFTPITRWAATVASVGWKGLLWTRDTLKRKWSSNITVVTSMVAPNTFLTIGKDLCSAKTVPSKSFTKWRWSAQETSKMTATMSLRFGNALISTIWKKSAQRMSWKEGSPGSQSASPPRLGSLFTSWRSCRCSNITATSSTSILTGGISSWSRWTQTATKCLFLSGSALKFSSPILSFSPAHTG